MNARLSFRKEAGKPTVFTFRRSDGSLTWGKLGNLPIEHDLAHYAVETTLGCKRAFFGLLDQGFTVDDFELPRDRRPQALLPINLPLEAQQVEHIVGRLQTELLCGVNSDFIADLRQTLALNGIGYPALLTSQTLADIRALFQDAIRQWRALEPGGQLDLPLVMP